MGPELKQLIKTPNDLVHLLRDPALVGRKVGGRLTPLVPLRRHPARRASACACAGAPIFSKSRQGSQCRRQPAATQSASPISGTQGEQCSGAMPAWYRAAAGCRAGARPAASGRRPREGHAAGGVAERREQQQAASRLSGCSLRKAKSSASEPPGSSVADGSCRRTAPEAGLGRKVQPVQDVRIPAHSRKTHHAPGLSGKNPQRAGFMLTSSRRSTRHRIFRHAPATGYSSSARTCSRCSPSSCGGAYNKIAKLSSEKLKRGVICASAGNHAQGVALSAAKIGCRAVIVMPTTTPQIKIQAVKNRGGEVVLAGDSYDEAYAQARSNSERRRN